MPGVEILSSAQVATEFTCNWWLAALIYAGMIIVGSVVPFCIADYDKWPVAIGGFVISVLCGLIIFVGLVNATAKPVAYETQYKVTISDSVSMTEFYEHYEVIEQEGKIFTVRERTE